MDEQVTEEPVAEEQVAEEPVAKEQVAKEPTEPMPEEEPLPQPMDDIQPKVPSTANPGNPNSEEMNFGSSKAMPIPEQPQSTRASFPEISDTSSS